MDVARAAELNESIKEHVLPGYQREESPEVPDMEVTVVGDFLGVDRPDSKDKDKLAFIKHQFEAENEADFLYQLRETERRLSPPKLGQRRIDIVYNYLRAKQAAHQAEKLRDSYLDGS